MRHTLTFLFLYIFISSSIGQDDLAIGQWQAHLPYTTFEGIAQNDEFLFFSTEWSLMVLDKEENTLRFVSKVDGLSETGIDVIRANKETGLLVVTYDNAVFDLITPEGIIGFTEISRDGNFNDRSINNIAFDGAQFIYFATGFGLVKFDTDKQEFVYTVSTGLSVSDVAIFNENIYISTEDGIYFIDKSDNANQQAFGDWQLLGSEVGLPPNYLNRYLEVKEDYLYLDVDSALVRFDGMTTEVLLPAETNFVSHFISSDNGKIVAGYECIKADGEGCTGKIATYDPATETLTELDNSCLARPTFAVEDEEGNIWSTDRFRRIRKTDGQGNGCDQKEFNSPFSHFIYELAVIDGSVYVASGGLKVSGNNSFREDGVFIRDKENNWTQFNQDTNSTIIDFAADRDFVRVAGHPSNDKIYYGTYYGGLVEIDGENTIVYNDTNSSLQGAAGDEPRERVSGLAFDAQENLWMANNGAPEAISVFTPDGEWMSYDVPATNLSELTVDRLGYKWAVINGTSQGLLVFDDNGTLMDTSDDRTRIITTNNSNLPDNQVLCVEADKDGDIWVGTVDGVVVFECGSTALESVCIGNKRVVVENDVDDESENLLKGEVINTIGIDEANRKWFGTSSGIFVQDENGTSNVAFYTEDNSPLLDDNVIDIAFDEETGDVYVGTEKGLIQLRSEAIAGGPVNSNNIYAYPNPVRPDYDGPIAIKGLAENANVKITDISGVLMHETTALGGQAIWDGRDYNGRKASTGVYLVFSTSDTVNLPDAASTKILFIK